MPERTATPHRPRTISPSSGEYPSNRADTTPILSHSIPSPMREQNPTALRHSKSLSRFSISILRISSNPCSSSQSVDALSPAIAYVFWLPISSIWTIFSESRCSTELMPFPPKRTGLSLAPHLQKKPPMPNGPYKVLWPAKTVKSNRLLES